MHALRKRFFVWSAFLVLLPLAFAAETNCQIKAITFDIGGVLARTPYSAYINILMRQVGPFLLLKQAFAGGFSKIKSRAFEVLMVVGGEQVPEAETGLLAYGDGEPLPQIFCDFMMGRVTREEIMAKVDVQLEKTGFSIPLRGVLRSKSEAKVVRAVCELMFGYAVYAQPIEGGVTLFNDCVDLLGGENVYVLSNWDKESFVELYQKRRFAELFDRVPERNLFVSGFEDDIKPHLSCFRSFCQKYNLRPDEVVFIDDQWENVAAARRIGMVALQVVDNDFAEIRRSLKKLGVVFDSVASGSKKVHTKTKQAVAKKAHRRHRKGGLLKKTLLGKLLGMA